MEVGILKGTGLAIWCDLFPRARVIGLDIDPTHFESNEATLRKLGAFSENEPEIYEYDQLVDNGTYLRGILRRDRVDVCIDDGLHSNESILMTIQSISPHLADSFVYFIEDNAAVGQSLAVTYGDDALIREGQLTIMASPDAR